MLQEGTPYLRASERIRKMQRLDFVRYPRGILSLLNDRFRDRMRLRHWSALLSFNDSPYVGRVSSVFRREEGRAQAAECIFKAKIPPVPGGEARCLEVIPITPLSTIYHSYIRGRYYFRKNLCEKSPLKISLTRIFEPAAFFDVLNVLSVLNVLNVLNSRYVLYVSVVTK